MTQDKSTKQDQPLEGEGSYSAARRYNQHLGDAIDAGDIEVGADAARRALEGPEGAALKRAAEEAKAGPRRKPSAPARKAKAR